MMEQLVGQSLGRYRLDALLGKGDMGAIFKARDITLQRDVAIRSCTPNSPDGPISRSASCKKRASLPS